MMRRYQLAFGAILTMIVVSCPDHAQNSVIQNVIEIDREWILDNAQQLLGKTPRKITEDVCDRSEGGPQDFYSEGDYWWPDPENPQGPYIRRDGESNPENFLTHRQAMRDMSMTVATLSAAFKLTGDERYAVAAKTHLYTWFLDPESRMNPNMAYAQAIKGRVPGRGVGLIDGIHLLDPVKSIELLNDMGQISTQEYDGYQRWFKEFLTWMTTHEYGLDERDRKNNHGTCWVLQAATYAKFTQNQEILSYCRDRYKTVLLPNQMSADGSFHLELSRTKPYGYALFNLDMMASVCHVLSTSDDNLWRYQLDDGRGIALAMAYMHPFILDKESWPLEPDVMYWDEWPARHPALLFASIGLGDSSYFQTWKRFPPVPNTQEGLRNFPIRQPLLWVEG